MSYEAARAALVTFVQTGWAAGAFPSVPIEMENIDLIDHDSQSAPFLTLDIAWRDAQAASMSGTGASGLPLKRQQGEMLFHIHLPDGKGSKQATQMADALDTLLTFQKVSGIQVLAASLKTSAPYKGWRIWPLSVPFWYDQG